jgi:D-hexose-6-phosphate mutarotase
VIGKDPQLSPIADGSQETMLQELNRFAIGEQLKFEMHPGGLVQGKINTDKCSGSFFLLGAHIAEFQPKSQLQPVLFMSEEAIFKVGKPIRGGIPICFPWFGPNKDDTSAPAHGLVRTALWDMLESSATESGVMVKLGYRCAPFRIALTAVFGETLDVTLDVKNEAATEEPCEVALHTYFQLGDSRRATIVGLEKNEFRDQLTGKIHAATGTGIKFTEETDRIYRKSVPLVTIQDEANSRCIHIKPRNSYSTVVWNPWVAKSQRLTDFGDKEFERMCCVETANVAPHNWVIEAGQSENVGFEVSVSN